MTSGGARELIVSLLLLKNNLLLDPFYFISFVTLEKFFE